MKLVKFKACPRNLWKSMQCFYEISGIQNVSTKLVEFLAMHVLYRISLV